MWDLRVPPTLSTDRWPLLKSQLTAGFDCVVIDTSPVLMVTDPLLMARHSDGVVISVLRNVSQFDAVAQSRDRLTALGIKVLGVVVTGLNGPTFDRSTLNYYCPTPSNPQPTVFQQSSAAP
jgi:Mrp family chromosome partitioning ATPase